MAEQPYRRFTHTRPRTFTGGIRGQSGGSSLWIGGDHILKVEHSRYSESYRRFYFRDIEAITIRETNRRLWWNVTWSVVIALLILLTQWLQADWIGVVRTLLLPVAAIVISSLLGPACTAYVRTAVQVEELPSLCRVNRARRKIQALRVMIDAAQGKFEPGEAWTRMREESDPGDNPSVITGPLNLS